MTDIVREHILTEYSRVIRDLFRQVEREQIIAALREIRNTGNFFGYEVLINHSILAPRAFEAFSRLAGKARDQFTPQERATLLTELDRLICESIRRWDDEPAQGKSADERAVESSSLTRGMPESRTVELLYGTDRSRVVEDGQIRYGSGRGELEVGLCSVTVPVFQVAAARKRPPWWKLEFREDCENHPGSMRALRLDEHSFLEQLRSRVGRSDENDVVVLIHGGGMSFDNAAIQAARMVVDLAFRGAPIMYSWPSRGDTDGYCADEDSVRWTLPHLEEFLRCVMDKSGAKRIHLIAHRMGARALTDAIRLLAQDCPKAGQHPMLSQVILVAPDIDAQVFRHDIVPALTEAAERVTLYASSEDQTLKHSRELRKEQSPRAGEGGDRIMLVAGIDSVDMPGVGTDFPGHDCFAEQLPLLNDLFLLLSHGLPPEERNLREKVVGKMRCWEVRG